jgi:hypothetical protein
MEVGDQKENIDPLVPEIPKDHIDSGNDGVLSSVNVSIPVMLEFRAENTIGPKGNEESCNDFHMELLEYKEARPDSCPIDDDCVLSKEEDVVDLEDSDLFKLKDTTALDSFSNVAKNSAQGLGSDSTSTQLCNDAAMKICEKLGEFTGGFTKENATVNDHQCMNSLLVDETNLCTLETTNFLSSNSLKPDEEIENVTKNTPKFPVTLVQEEDSESEIITVDDDDSSQEESDESSVVVCTDEESEADDELLGDAPASPTKDRKKKPKTKVDTIPEIEPPPAEELNFLRFKSQFRLKTSWERIFEKYGREFDSDEVDLMTGEVCNTNKGYYR